MVTAVKFSAFSDFSGSDPPKRMDAAAVGSGPVTASPHDAPHQPPGRPAPLTVATSLAALEALGYAGYGVTEIAVLSADRPEMGVTTAVFFLLYGAGLGVCAWAVHRLQSWARAPVVLVQIIQLLLAWNFRGGETSWLSVVLGVSAVVVLAGILHPRSIDALADHD